MTAVGAAVVRVGRLVWEAGAAVGPLLGNSDAMCVLGRWLDGADAGRAEDALLASYHLRDKDLLALAPAIARWVGVESAAPHVRRLLSMAPVKELRPVLVPALAVGVGLALGLRGAELLVPVTTAALPCAQNVFMYATRYGAAKPLARDCVLLTTAGFVPVILLAAALLS